MWASLTSQRVNWAVLHVQCRVGQRDDPVAEPSGTLGMTNARCSRQNTVRSYATIGAIAGLLLQSVLLIRMAIDAGWPGVAEVLAACVVTFFFIGGSAVVGCAVGAIVNLLSMISRKQQ